MRIDRIFLALLCILVICLSVTSASQADPCPAWQPAKPHPMIRHQMAYDSIRQVAVMFTGTETWEWNGLIWSRRSNSGPSARFGMAIAFDAQRGVTVLFGGDPTGTLNESVNDTWEWDGAVWTPRDIPDPPPGRHDHVMTYDSARQVIVMAGGFTWNTSQYLGDTWEYDGSHWVLRDVGGFPARSRSAMAFDSLRSVTVMTGGFNGSRLNGLFEWDGVAWTTRPVGPTHNYWHTLAFDSARGVMVQHGGSTDAWDEGDAATREYDGDTWTTVITSGGSPHRMRHAMVYDAARAECVMFAGIATPTYGDTLAYQGTEWVERAGCPADRRQHAMVFDANRGAVVLFGGDGNQIYDDTWLWDGAKWTELDVAVHPNFAKAHAMVYDSTRQVVIFWGAYNSSAGPTLWELSGDTWSNVPSAQSPLPNSVAPWPTTAPATGPCYSAARAAPPTPPAFWTKPGSGTDPSGRSGSSPAPPPVATVRWPMMRVAAYACSSAAKCPSPTTRSFATMKPGSLTAQAGRRLP
ncbi:MAG: hypothetical protein IPK83_07445 [Planctomycetes bacterium]|nr:hypothetical protein [Planctomycetota bacterium]